MNIVLCCSVFAVNTRATTAPRQRVGIKLFGFTKEKYDIVTSINSSPAGALHHNLPAAKAPTKSDVVISIGIVMIGSGREADGTADEACNAVETESLSVLKAPPSGGCVCSSKPSDSFDILQEHSSVK